MRIKRTNTGQPHELSPAEKARRIKAAADTKAAIRDGNASTWNAKSKGRGFIYKLRGSDESGRVVKTNYAGKAENEARMQARAGEHARKLSKEFGRKINVSLNAVSRPKAHALSIAEETTRRKLGPSQSNKIVSMVGRSSLATFVRKLGASMRRFVATFAPGSRGFGGGVGPVLPDNSGTDLDCPVTPISPWAFREFGSLRGPFGF